MPSAHQTPRLSSSGGFNLSHVVMQTILWCVLSVFGLLVGIITLLVSAKVIQVKVLSPPSLDARTWLALLIARFRRGGELIGPCSAAAAVPVGQSPGESKPRASYSPAAEDASNQHRHVTCFWWFHSFLS